MQLIQNVAKLISSSYLVSLGNLEAASEYKKNFHESSPHTLEDGWLCIVKDSIHTGNSGSSLSKITTKILISTNNSLLITKIYFTFPCDAEEKASDRIFNLNAMNSSSHPFAISYSEEERLFKISTIFEFEILQKATDSEALEKIRNELYALTYTLKRCFIFLGNKFNETKKL
jgi:hypothetical protein